MGYEVLYNFISPVTGRILCDTDKVLVGDAKGIAIPSTFIPIGALPDLPMGNIWIGNDMNRPIPNPTIGISNLPDLLMGNLFIGDSMNRPIVSKTITIDNLPNLSSGKVWIGNGMIPSRPVEGTPPQGPPGPPGPEGAAGADPDNLASSGLGSAVSSGVKFGLEKLFGGSVGFFSTLLGGAIGTVGVGGVYEVTKAIGTAINKIPAEGEINDLIDNRLRVNARNSSKPLPPGAGAPTASDKNIVYYFVDMNLGGGRIENISPSPLADLDAINAKWAWDLLNDNVEIIFGEQQN